jgi:uncharacterized membrane protein
MSFAEVATAITVAFEAVGLFVITVGALWAGGRFAGRLVGRESMDASYQMLRRELGRSILLGLEILVAADIIRTAAVEPSLENVAILAAIVLIRTFLSFSLEVETEGTLPWRRAA